MKDRQFHYTYSTVGFKRGIADLHRFSGYLFLCSLVFATAVTVFIITRTFSVSTIEVVEQPLPVVILVENIPEIEHRVTGPAPPVPFPEPAIPLELGEIVPDDVMIEAPERPGPSDVVPDVPAGSYTSGGTGPDEGTYDVSAVEEPPRRVTNVVPEYPPLALRAGIEGTVIIKALVNVRGTVDSVTVVDGPEVFRNAASVAAATTNFSPARINNRPVACWVIMQYRFDTTNR
ncbi:energy transducer TonB [Candidatus Latescibacterota bacterium]